MQQPSLKTKASKVGDLAKLSDMDLYLAPGSGQTVVQKLPRHLVRGLNLTSTNHLIRCLKHLDQSFAV